MPYTCTSLNVITHITYYYYCFEQPVAFQRIKEEKIASDICHPFAFWLSSSLPASICIVSGSPSSPW